MDAEIQKQIASSLDEILALKKEEYASTLESFDVHAAKLRYEWLSQLEAFALHYNNGYQLLLDEVRKELPDDNSLEPYLIKPDRLNELNLIDTLINGQTLGELLGLTEPVIWKFYETAKKFLDAGLNEKAKDAFYFLTTIAPNIPACWLALGISYLRTGEFSEANMAFEETRKLDPHNPDAYLASIACSIRQNDKEAAYQLCEKGLQLAYEATGSEWAQKLGTLLTEAKRHIQIH